MLRILINWYHTEIGMVGNVTAYNSVANEFVAEWLIETDNNAIKHKPKGVDTTLPVICQDEEFMREIESMVKIYMTGYNRKEEVYKWITPVEPKVEDKCLYCGNAFDSKYTDHVTCGME